MTDEPSIYRALLAQARGCLAGGSPLNAALLTLAAEDWSQGGPVRGLMAPWSDLDYAAQLDAATPLRLIAALHELSLSGAEPKLTAAYGTGDAERVWAAAQGAMERHNKRLAAFMEHEPQTNEVRRSICLVGGFLEVAAATGLPLRCFEIGASAGLNSSWDRYRYQLGRSVWGNPDAPVSMDAEWQGDAPPVYAPVKVIERAACDRRPPDLHDEDQRRRLLAYVWADQAERLARARAAIGDAITQGVAVEAADAVTWTAQRVTPADGAATVLFHSVFWQYMPADSQAALRQVIHDIGARATPTAPFAWLRMEPGAETMMVMEVRLTLWPGGKERLLAKAHPHGATVTWLGA